MRKAQVVLLVLGALFAGLGVFSLVSASAIANVLAGVFLVLLSLPFFLLGGLLKLGQTVADSFSQSQRSDGRRKVLAALERLAPAATWDELRAGVQGAPDALLVEVLEALRDERRLREDFDEERGAYVYVVRSEAEVAALDPDAPPVAAPEAPEECVSLAERRRRIERSRERAG